MYFIDISTKQTFARIDYNVILLPKESAEFLLNHYMKYRSSSTIIFPNFKVVNEILYYTFDLKFATRKSFKRFQVN